MPKYLCLLTVWPNNGRPAGTVRRSGTKSDTTVDKRRHKLVAAGHIVVGTVADTLGRTGPAVVAVAAEAKDGQVVAEAQHTWAEGFHMWSIVMKSQTYLLQTRLFADRLT